MGGEFRESKISKYFRLRLVVPLMAIDEGRIVGEEEYDRLRLV